MTWTTTSTTTSRRWVYANLVGLVRLGVELEPEETRPAEELCVVTRS